MSAISFSGALGEEEKSSSCRGSMRPGVEAALTRVLHDQSYREAVVAWIEAHRPDEANCSVWTGKSDLQGTPVMNICNGGPPVTVAVETILHVLEHKTLPEDEAPLIFPSPSTSGEAAP